MLRIRYISLVCLAIALLIFEGCSGKSGEVNNKSPQVSADNRVLRVAAAADLALAFKEIGERFEKQNGCKVQLVMGSSGTLAQQIESGAPFDVFASADVRYINELKGKGKIVPGTERFYAQGRIVLATRATGSLQVKKIGDLTSREIKKIAIANPEHAPYGAAAQQALEKAGLWGKVKDKLVYGKNIQDTLTLIETGNADVGIIAISIASKKVRLYPVDESLYRPLKQYIGVVKGTRQEDLARKFAEYVVSEEFHYTKSSYGVLFEQVKQSPG